MLLICDLCGEVFDSEDSETCPNCGSYSVRKDEDNV